jgi:uncharacterized protein (DUF58 family)
MSSMTQAISKRRDTAVKATFRLRLQSSSAWLGGKSRHRFPSPLLSWCFAYASRYVTLTGAAVLLCLAAFLPVALQAITAMPLSLLFVPLASLLPVNLLLGYLLRPRVRCLREPPRRIAAGSTGDIQYRVRNVGRRPVYDLTVDSLPFPLFFSLPAGRMRIDCLAPGEEVTLRMPLRATRRGSYRLPAMYVASGFPFHLWQWGMFGKGDRVVYVHPAFKPLAGLELSSRMMYHPGGISLSSKIGHSLEFQGTREYREGDDIRQIHWRSWARLGRPVVREYREEYLCHTAVVMDTLRPRPFFWQEVLPPVDRVFEAAASLTAAVADHLARQDVIVDLFAAGPDLYRFRGGRSLGFLDNMLDVLACLEPAVVDPFAELSEELLTEIAEISGVVLILLSWDEPRQRLIDRLRQLDVDVTAFLIRPEGQASREEYPEWLRVLAPEAIMT